MDILITPRLTIRPLLEVDADALVAHLNDPKVTCNLHTLPKPYRVEDAQAFLKSVDEDKNQRGYVIARERAIGMIGFHDYNPATKTAHLGYWLASHHHGKGYMGEALDAVLEKLFAEGWLERIESDVFSGNQASENLQRKLGFVFSGSVSQHGRTLKYSALHKDAFLGQRRLAA